MAPFSCRKEGNTEAPAYRTYTLLTSVHNDADDANNYNMVIGTAELKAFSCAKIKAITDMAPTTNITEA